MIRSVRCYWKPMRSSGTQIITYHPCGEVVYLRWHERSCPDAPRACRCFHCSLRDKWHGRTK